MRKREKSVWNENIYITIVYGSSMVLRMAYWKLQNVGRSIFKSFTCIHMLPTNSIMPLSVSKIMLCTSSNHHHLTHNIQKQHYHQKWLIWQSCLFLGFWSANSLSFASLVLNSREKQKLELLSELNQQQNKNHIDLPESTPTSPLEGWILSDDYGM